MTGVLDVLDRYGAHLPSDHAEARAAVAELIEAASDVERRAGPDREPRLRAAMSGLPSLDDVNAQIDAMFCPKRKKRALDWAQTPEGRETLAGQLEELKSLPKPVSPTGG